MSKLSWTNLIDWNATENSVCPLPNDTLHEVWFRDGGKSCVDGSPQTWSWKIEDSDTIVAYRYELTEERPTGWDGIGLPPVGADQNVFVPATRISAAGSDSPRSTWKVVAHHNGHAVVCIDEFGTGQHGAHIIPASGSRPLRT